MSWFGGIRIMYHFMSSLKQNKEALGIIKTSVGFIYKPTYPDWKTLPNFKVRWVSHFKRF